jgi:Holliday junction resolvase RusA-like endonuclease
MSNYVSIPVNPMGAVRQTRRDVWKKRPCVEKYHAFRDTLRHYSQTFDFLLSDNFKIMFYIPMPKSWSQKKRDKMYMLPHDQKPDIDNLIKAVMDALKPDDKKVWKISAEKRWAFEGEINIKNMEEL